MQYSEEKEDKLQNVTTDKNSLIEIMSNYLGNALHATKAKEGEKIVRLKIYRYNQHYVRLELSDNGYGIDEVTKKKLFETTYTSKPHNEGTGLGLWRVRKVCEQIQAKFGFDSEGRGQGARFWVDVKIG